MLKQCVLIGKQGSGKTSFFNKICKKKELVSDGLDSCTKLITTSRSKDVFQVVDTPGISFMNNVFENHIAIVAALTQGPIHKILLVVKYDYRIEELYSSVFQIIQLVSQYYQLLGAVITHFDQCNKDVIQDYQDQAQKMLQMKFNIKFILYSGNNDSGEQFSLAIQKSLLEAGMVVKITDNNFDDMMLSYEFNKQLEKGKVQIQQDLKKFNNTVRHFLKDFEPQQNQDEILYSLLVFVRKEQNTLLEKFEKKYGHIMEEIHQKSDNPLQAYYYHYVIKFHVKKSIQQLIEIINKKMIYPEDHPFRQLRRCPFCQTMWLKVIGCESTQCGKKLSQMDEIHLTLNKQLNKQLNKEYEFYYDNEQMIQFKQTNVNYDQEIQFQLSQVDNFQKISFREILIELLQLDTQELIDSISPIEKCSGQKDLQKVDQKALTISPFGRKKITQILLEKQQAEQIAKNKRIGCGREFKWDEAPLVNLEDLDLTHQEILAIFSDKDSLYQQEFQSFKQKQIKNALKKQKYV